jgi:hypothetical protein
MITESRDLQRGPGRPDRCSDEVAALIERDGSERLGTDRVVVERGAVSDAASGDDERP